MKNFYEWILFISIVSGLLLVFSGAGGLETESTGLKSIYVILAGFIAIMVIIFYCNREKKFPLTFSENLKLLRKRGF